ncbi:MAG: gamma-glutamyl-gamma-aminobutyrate hydrolase family protein [Candidatus Paceibacterota bacterium]
MAKVLIIQFKKNKEAVEFEKRCFSEKLYLYSELRFINALSDEVDWGMPELIMADLDCVILSGSNELDFDGGRPEDDLARITSKQLVSKLSPFLRYLFDKDVPTLGICYGHQLIGAFAGVTIRYSEEQKKTASHELKFLLNHEEIPLFSGLPATIIAHYGHKDVLVEVPKDAQLLFDGGERCLVPALKYKENIFTFQFHPELTHTDIMKRAVDSPGYLPEGSILTDIFKPDDCSNLIVRNFCKFVEEVKSKKQEIAGA